MGVYQDLTFGIGAQTGVKFKENNICIGKGSNVKEYVPFYSVHLLT